MRSTVTSFIVLSLLTLAGCSAGGPDLEPEPIAEERSPILGGVPDLSRSYVVGIADDVSVFCTGTLVSRRSVLTAGHCYGHITRVVFGPNVASNPVSIDVVKSVRHPGYDRRSMSNDLTMVELAADAPTQPAPLLRETMDASFVGPSFTFVGYGNDGHARYDVRRVTTFPIAAIGPSDLGTSGGSGPIDATMFYYNVPLKNTCSGDSGGPAFVARGPVERVAGATSYGDKKCVIDGVDARTDAPQIAAFIQPMIDEFEGRDRCRADGVCDESCNVNGMLGDPDCAEQHCGADGICALSCTNPVDPDCRGLDRCGADGACDPSCPSPDPDCNGAVAAPEAPASSAVNAGTGGGGGAGAGGGTSSSSSEASGARGDVPKSENAATEAGGPEFEGSGCSAAGRRGEANGGLAVVLGLGACGAWRRRRARSLRRAAGERG